MDESGPSISTGILIYIGAGILALAIWIGGIVYAEQIATEKGYNVWTARIVCILLPVIGPLIFWLLGMRPTSGPPNDV
jgi:hypothetical protein